MRDALRRHDAMLREEIEARGGYIFKTIGDAFCAAFPSVGDALEAAVATQRRLGREDFSAVDGMPVRMAIHTGLADERDGDYFGSAVNRTARLLSAGHGGQILLSGEAADSTLAALPSGVTLRHLGVLPLRGIKEPERVFQPVGAALRSQFKPLRALETPPNNLPRQTTSFVGRHEDLVRVEASLDEGPLLTITGAGGIGKTRLALEVATERLNDERDGAWFVDLSAVGDPGLIAGTILTTVGGELSSSADPLDDLIGYLKNRELLLVLDNSEHLVSDVARVVAEVVARCAHVVVLATSRSPLDISGERVYRLASLDSSAAMQLFADRARAVSPSFRLESKRGVVEEICTRLDGIALAIELAAARIRTMPVESVASHLELRLLSGGRDRRPRQQTMRALIDWSFDLLSEDEQRALRRTAVFLRGFTLEATIQVCADEGDDELAILDLLASLVDKSLVVLERAEENQRYRLLEPIREYAWQKLKEAAELDEMRRRHTKAYAGVAHAWYLEWDEAPASDWIERVERDLANLRAALRWSVEERNDLEMGAAIVADSTIVFLRLGLLVEGIEWCNRILESGAQFAPGSDARLRYGLSMLYSNLGANQKCLEQAVLAARQYRAIDDRRGLSRALSQVASRYALSKRYDEAKTAAEEAIALARIGRDRRLLADVLRRSAGAFGEDEEARVRALFAESVDLFRSCGRNDETARALDWWAQWEETERGNYAEAAQRLLEAVAMDSHDSGGMMVFRTNDIATCYLAMGDRSRAELFARQSLQLAVKSKHVVFMALAVFYLAAVAGDRFPQRAARLVGYAKRQLHDAGWELISPDTIVMKRLQDALRSSIDAAELARLMDEGAALSADDAIGQALAS